MRIELVAVLATYMEATLALSVAAESPIRRSTLVRQAQVCASSLRNRRAIWAAGVALLIEAGIEATLGHSELASARWADAELELNRCGMRMYSAAAQLCRGRISGDTEAVMASSTVFLRRGVVSPVRFAISLAPGMRS